MRSSAPTEASEPDVWEALDSALAPERRRPTLRPGVEIARIPARTGDYAIARSPDGSTHVRLESWEADLAARLDGSASIAELTAEAFSTGGDLRPSAVAELAERLRAAGLLTAPSTDVWEVLAYAREPRWRGLRRFARDLSLEWSGADRFVRTIYGAGLKAAFHPFGLALGIALAIAGLVAFGVLVSPGRFHLRPTHPGVEFLVLWTLNLVVVGLHELGHGIVIAHRRGVVRSAGVRLHIGPTLFVDSADSLLLPRRWRIIHALAGSYAVLVFAAPAAILLAAWPEMLGADTLYKWVVLSYFVTLMHLVPLLDLDGYWALSDSLRIPDLRERSWAFLRRDLWRHLRRREGLSQLDAVLAAFAVFGIIATAAGILLGIYAGERLLLPVIQRMWDGGASGRTLLVVLVAVVAAPLVRGLLDLVRARADDLVDLIRRIRFRLQRRWRLDAAQTLDATGIFGDVPEAVLHEIATRVRLRTVRSGETVVRQGDPADAFYLVRHGRLRVIEEDREGGSERVLGVLESGDAFGELGLLGAPVRTATVRAVTRSSLYEIDGSSFRSLLADRAATGDYVVTLEQTEAVRSHPAFRHLYPAQARTLVESGGFEHIAPGTEIVRQGDAADAFYAIFSGRAEVVEDGVRRRELGQGDYFGEIALVRGGSRTATVRATTPMRVFRLDPAAFHRLVGQSFRVGRLPSSADHSLRRGH